MEAGWTPEKRRIAYRSFGQFAITLAAQINVPANELLRVMLKGDVPPEGRETGFADTVLPPPETAAPRIITALPAPAPTPRLRWTQERAETVRRMAGNIDRIALAASLGVTVASLQVFAHKQGISLRFHQGMPTFWTDERREAVRSKAGTMPPGDLAKLLGVTRSALANAANELGVSLRYAAGRKRQAPTVWTETRVTELRTLAGTMPSAELAARLGVTVVALIQAAGKHKVSLKFDGETPRAEPKVWTDALVEKVRRLALEGNSASQIGDILGKPRNAVISICHRKSIVLTGRPSGRVAASRNKPAVPSAHQPLVVQPQQRWDASPSTAWIRLRRRDGTAWLSTDGKGWVRDRAHAYICKTGQLEAARRAFPLVAQCEAIEVPQWRPRDGERVLAS